MASVEYAIRLYAIMLLALRSKSGVYILAETEGHLRPLDKGDEKCEMSTQTEERLLQRVSIHISRKSISPAPNSLPVLRRSIRHQSVSPVPRSAKQRLSRSFTPVLGLPSHRIHNQQLIRASARKPLGLLAKDIRHVTRPVLRNITLRAAL